MLAKPKKRNNHTSKIKVLILACAILIAGVFCAYTELSKQSSLNKQLLSELGDVKTDFGNKIRTFQEIGGDDLSEKVDIINALAEQGKFEEAIAEAQKGIVEINISTKKLEKENQMAKEKKAAEIAKQKADEEAKKASETAVAKTKTQSAVAYKAPIYTPPKATGTCSKNEYYVVVNVSTNTEQIYMGDPDCRTGSVKETRRVATGRQEWLWNPGGWSYWGGTPTGKWRIISKESTSGQFGPWFLRMHYLNGGYVDQYALHGTDDNSSIGKWASHGCIRHYNADIIHLVSILKVGTVVWTVN